MASSSGKKSGLRIRSVLNEEVANAPHYEVLVEYQGIRVEFEDIYFDTQQELKERLDWFANNRNNSIKLDGGLRFQIELIGKWNGALDIKFALEKSPPSFPGKLALEGMFEIEGEMVNDVIVSLQELFFEGKEFQLEE